MIVADPKHSPGQQPDVTYNVATAHKTSPKDRLIHGARALARRVVRWPTRAFLRGLCTVDGMLHAAPPIDTDKQKSRVMSTAQAKKAGLPVVRASTPVPVLRAGKKTRIFLLNPPRYCGIPVARFYRSEYLFVDEHAIPSTDLAYFAAAARDLADVALTEANAEDISNEEVMRRIEAFQPDVIVLKALINVMEHDLTVPLAYKQAHPHVTVVACSRSSIGAEAKILAEFPGLDGIARGEVDAFAADLAADPRLEGPIDGLFTRDRPTSVTRVVEDLDRHPIPAFEMMPRVWYRGAQSGAAHGFSSAYFGAPSGYYVIASRGCPYTCTYCMTGGIDGRPFRMRKRSPENVVEEIRQLHAYGIKDFYFFDEIFTMPGHAEPICEAIIASGLKVHFVCDGKPDLVTPEMLRLMKAAGCVAIYHGVESGDPGILKDVRKGQEAGHAAKAIKMTQAAGMLAATYITIGYPNETWQTYLNTVGFLLETKPDMVRYGFLTPYPITVLHKQMKDAGLLLEGMEHSDRRISPFHDAAIPIRSKALGPRTLQIMDALLKHTFSTELARTPMIASE